MMRVASSIAGVLWVLNANLASDSKVWLRVDAALFKLAHRYSR